MPRLRLVLPKPSPFLGLKLGTRVAGRVFPGAEAGRGGWPALVRTRNPMESPRRKGAGRGGGALPTSVVAGSTEPLMPGGLGCHPGPWFF